MQHSCELYQKMDQALFEGPAIGERITFVNILKEYAKKDPPELRDKELSRGVDIGTVSGFYTAFFLHYGMEAYALNNDEEALKYLLTNAIFEPYMSEVQLIHADMRQLPFDDNSVDIMTVMTGTFSYLENGTHQNALEEFARVLTSNAVLIISDWNLKAEEQDFFGLYTKEQEKELELNHLGYPHLLETLRKKFTPQIGMLCCDNRLYMVLSTKKDE